MNAISILQVIKEVNFAHNLHYLLTLNSYSFAFFKGNLHFENLYDLTRCVVHVPSWFMINDVCCKSSLWYIITKCWNPINIKIFIIYITNKKLYEIQLYNYILLFIFVINSIKMLSGSPQANPKSIISIRL